MCSQFAASTAAPHFLKPKPKALSTSSMEIDQLFSFPSMRFSFTCREKKIKKFAVDYGAKISCREEK